MPPTELTSYMAWCAARALQPYGDPEDLVSMRAAVEQWKLWQLEREAWTARQGVGLEMDHGCCDMPWDPDAI